MSTHLLLEAAVRSLVMGAIIFAVLGLLRIEHVRTRRTAWLLALAGALAMPLLVAAQIGPRLLPEVSFAHQPSVEALTVAPPGSALRTGQDLFGVDFGSSLDHSAYAVVDKGKSGAQLAHTALLAAAIGYCAVAAFLALRLCAGVGFALRLKNQADRVVFAFDPELETRTSARIATPVTIGSSVLLPDHHTLWDGMTLRVVLAHERAHVRQKDFYVQMLAGLHCALFWFNPFSWWLQRHLSELGEALSDCAAVQQAESRASYAETLLAFATRAHLPISGVAMASASNLTPRIERLLSERGFERSFAPKRRLPFIAAAVVAVAMFVSTSMVRVHAGQPNGRVNANTVTVDAVTANTSASTSSNTTAAPAAASAATITPATPPAPAAAATRPAKKAAKVKQESGDTDVTNSENDEADVGRDPHEEGILAIHSGHSRIMIDSGGSLPPHGGDYIYFQHDGKPYLIQDPQIIAQAQALLEPMKELSEKQKELGHQQAMLGAQQRTLVAQNQTIKMVQTPEFKQQIEELQKTIKEMDFPRLTGKIDQQALAEVQSHLGEIQARVGQLQAQFGRIDGQFGEQEGKLGEQQGKLGEQQALLGEQQRKIIEDARRQLKPLIEQAIREGKGKVVAID